MTCASTPATPATPAPAARRGDAAFTLLELMVVVSLIGIVAAIGFSSYARARPRLNLSTTVSNLAAAIGAARQEAIGSGRDVAVLLYPKTAISPGIRGRIVIFYDGDGGFMLGAPPAGDPSFCTFNPLLLGPGIAGTKNRVITTIDLPQSVVMTAPTSLVNIPFPYNQVPAPVNGCSFCDAAVTTGAIRFDARGRASFYSTCGGPGPSTTGGSFSLTSTEVTGSYVLVITPTGIVRSYNAG